MTYLQKAIMKYGENSFKVEEVHKLLEDEDLNWSQVERYFIKKYKSNTKEIGYNLTEGGDKPPIKYGENNFSSKLSDKEFYEIIELIKNSDLCLTEIARRYKIHDDTITRINNGTDRHQDNLTYPLRECSVNKIKAIKIMKLLIHTDFKFSTIAKIVGVKIPSIVNINTGFNYSNFFISELKYPIRDNLEVNQFSYPVPEINKYLYYKIKFQDCNKDEERALKICMDLITERYSKISDLAKHYKIGTSLIYQLNLGNVYKQLLSIFVFPIRNNIQINKQILNEIEAVETIPLIGK